MQNKYKEAMAEAEREKERYFNPVKRQSKPTRRATPQPETLPIAGDADGIAQPQAQPQSRNYMEEVSESMSRDSGVTFIGRTPRRSNQRQRGIITSNSNKGGEGAKWRLHKQINERIQQRYTRKMICEELGICRMTLWRHENIY